MLLLQLLLWPLLVVIMFFSQVVITHILTTHRYTLIFKFLFKNFLFILVRQALGSCWFIYLFIYLFILFWKIVPILPLSKPYNLQVEILFLLKICVYFIRLMFVQKVIINNRQVDSF